MTEISYRPDIDGLRAIAVMLVLGFHAFPEAVPGGFIGVDVFFVISGFVIPLSLQGRDYRIADFPRFMIRRLVRLEPPYLVSIALTILLSIQIRRQVSAREESNAGTAAVVTS